MMKKASQESRIVGVIDIGSSAIRLVIMEIKADGSFKRVDRASRPVQLGRDVFVNRVLSRETISQAILILQGFNELIGTWKISPNDLFVIATSAIREAKNRETFLDRVYIKTGLKIKIVDGVEENHLTFLAVTHAIGDFQGNFTKTASMIIEVGGGSTELMVIEKGKVVSAHLFRIGTLRLDSYSRDSTIEINLEDQFKSTFETVKNEYNLSKIKYYVMVGGDARTAATHIGKRLGDHYSIIEREKFLEFIEKIQLYKAEDCVRNLNLTYYEAESLIPALKAHKMFLESTSAQEIIVPDVSIREGVLLRFALGKDTFTQKDFEAQVQASALALGRKYSFDEAHGLHVSKMATKLFDALQGEHALSSRERTYLSVASMLHDIGYFVRATGHHKHGAYIVANSEVFGLNIEDMQIISQIVRYHRSVRPSLEHVEFLSLSPEQRLVVTKCAAILRVADCLDRSHSQRFKNLEVKIEGDQVLITSSFSGDHTIEQWALNQKGELFEDVFGYRVLVV